jgi:hypothetical protein
VTSSFMEGPFIHHRQQLPGIDTTWRMLVFFRKSSIKG